MNKRIVMLAAAICLIGTTAMGQFFVPQATQLAINDPGQVTLTDGTVYENCFMKGFALRQGSISKIKIETADGDKEKIDAADVQSMQFPPSDMSRLSSAMEATQSLQTINNANFDDIVDQDMCYYEQRMSPGRRGQLLLMQVINPGFNSKLTVYADAFARETMGVSVGGVALAGGLDKSYFVYNGEETLKIEKKEYDEQFVLLFGDCPEMAERFPDPKWKDFAGHVFAYDQLCAGE